VEGFVKKKPLLFLATRVAEELSVAQKAAVATKDMPITTTIKQHVR